MSDQRTQLKGDMELNLGTWKLGEGGKNFISNTYLLHCHHQNDCIKVGICESHFDISFIVWAKSKDSVHNHIFFKRKESRSGSNRGPSAYQPGALPLGHTGSRPLKCRTTQVKCRQCDQDGHKAGGRCAPSLPRAPRPPQPESASTSGDKLEASKRP